MKTLSFASAVVSLALAVACGGTSPDPNTPVSSPSSPDCSFKVKDSCYATAVDACAAAGCSADKCIQAETHPVQVRCEK